jgi:hypothetical protein
MDFVRRHCGVSTGLFDIAVVTDAPVTFTPALAFKLD